MAVLGTIFAGSWAASGSGAKPKTAEGPPINASSKEEGDFIQYVTVPVPVPVLVPGSPIYRAADSYLSVCITDNGEEIS